MNIMDGLEPGRGHNRPPSALASAVDAAEALARWLTDHPAITGSGEAADAATQRERAEIALYALEAERKAAVEPLNDRVSAINAQYRPTRNRLKDDDRRARRGLLDVLADRLSTWMISEEKRRRAEAEEARQRALALEMEARRAEEAEREAHADAQVGVCTDVGAATEAADTAFEQYTEAQREAADAAKSAKVRVESAIGGRFALRTTETLTVSDAGAAIADMLAAGPLPPKVADAILAAARAFRTSHGRLPAGITSSKEKRV